MNNENLPKRKGLLLDIMLNDRYVCQLRYNRRGWPENINGKIVEVYEMRDLQRFVEDVRPSLKGKPYHIFISNQRVKFKTPKDEGKTE